MFVQRCSDVKQGIISKPVRVAAHTAWSSMTFLNPHLPFTEDAGSSSGLPPQGSHLVISDTLPAPGDFALYHIISAAVASKKRIIWVDFRQEGRNSLEAALRKTSVALPASNTGTFLHIQPTSFTSPANASQPVLFTEDDELDLRSTYDAIVTGVSQGNAPCLVLLDGLSELTNMGIPTSLVAQLVRALRGSLRKTGSTLVSTLHTDGLENASELLESLLRIASGWWRIEGLASGRSGDVHGEITSHPLLGDKGVWPVVSKSQPLQYRLEASTVKVFPKGTGRGYL